MTNRGRPPDATFDHLELYSRVQEFVDNGHSVRNACRLVKNKYYPDRAEGGIRQTYIELTTVKVDPKEKPERDGYIHGDKFKPSPVRARMMDLYRRLAWYFSKKD